MHSAQLGISAWDSSDQTPVDVQTTDSNLASAYLQATESDSVAGQGEGGEDAPSPAGEDAPSPAHVSQSSSSIIEEDVDFGFGDDLEVESMGSQDLSLDSADDW